MPEYLTSIRLLHVNVGPVRPADYAQNRRRPRSKDATAGNLQAEEAERVLRGVHWNFTTLTRTVLMAEIEDLPPSMQPHYWIKSLLRINHAIIIIIVIILIPIED
jgi:hypothetical protein